MIHTLITPFPLKFIKSSYMVFCCLGLSNNKTFKRCCSTTSFNIYKCKNKKKFIYLNFSYLLSKYNVNLHDYVLKNLLNSPVKDIDKDILSFLYEKLICIITYISVSTGLVIKGKSVGGQYIVSISFGFQKKDRGEFIKRNFNLDKLFLINDIYKFNIKGAVVLNSFYGEGDLPANHDFICLGYKALLKKKKYKINHKISILFRLPIIMLNDLLMNSKIYQKSDVKQKKRKKNLYNFYLFHNALIISTLELYYRIRLLWFINYRKNYPMQEFYYNNIYHLVVIFY